MPTCTMPLTTFTRQLAPVSVVRARRKADLTVRPIVTPEFAQVQEGNSVNVDLHANESGTRDRSKTRITQHPNAGNASIASGILTYTPDAGWLGWDVVGYQLANSDGIYGATGYCTVQTIEGTIIIIPGGEIPMPDIDISNTVSSQSALNDRISEATSTSVTREIVLANGNYTIALTAANRNLVIRAQNVNGAKITNRVNLRGTDVILRSLWIPEGVTMPESTDAQRCRVSRCKVDGTLNDGIWVAGYNTIIDGCVVSNTVSAISGDGMRTARLNRNHVKSTSGVPNRCMYLGHGGTNQAPLDLTIDYNRTEGILEHQHIEHKSSNNLVHHHHAIGNAGALANVYSRHGQNNVYSHCYADNGVIGAADEDNLIADCVSVNSGGKGCVARAGEISGDDIRTTDKTGIVYSEDAIIRRCSGPVGIGWNQGSDSHGPMRTQLEGISASQVYVEKADTAGHNFRSSTGAPLYSDPAHALNATTEVGQFWNAS